jgi:hypothetical protein
MIKLFYDRRSSRPVCLGVELRSGANDQNFVFCLIIEGLLMWGALSGGKMGLYFTCTIAFRLCQSSHCRVQVLQNSRPYFNGSYETSATWMARFQYLCPTGRMLPGHWVPFSSPITTRRVEIF